MSKWYKFWNVEEYFEMMCLICDSLVTDSNLRKRTIEVYVHILSASYNFPKWMKLRFEVEEQFAS